jgi:DNA segregation ATPase FtsK/SpoIIIE-like protein
MKATDTVLSGSLHKVIEAVERLEDVKPLTVGQLQRTLTVGYGRAGAYMDLFEELGIVSRAEGERGERTLLIRGRHAAVVVMRCLCEVIDAAFEDGNCALAKQESLAFESEEMPLTVSVKPAIPTSPLTATDDVELSDADDKVTPPPPPLPTDPAALLRCAVEYVCTQTEVGTSKLQRNLKIGYGRAAMLIDRMEELGIVGPYRGGMMGREVLLSLEEALARLDGES